MKIGITPNRISYWSIELRGPSCRLSLVDFEIDGVIFVGSSGNYISAMGELFTPMSYTWEMMEEISPWKFSSIGQYNLGWM